MNVPQELLDEILRHLPSDEGRSLKSCSLVSKYWLEPSRRLLFASIRINHDNFKLWLERVPPTNTRLLFYVRSLTYFLRGSGTSGFGSVYVFRDYFPSFCQLQNLTLCHLHIEPTIPERLHMFSAFQHTLTSLSFGVVSITWGAFVALVGYFSNLRNLSLLATSFRMDEKPAPRIARPGRGKLFIDLATKAAVSFPHHRFADLRPEYEELEILGAYEHRLVSAVERTLKSLKIGLCGCTSTSTQSTSNAAPYCSNRLWTFLSLSKPWSWSLTLSRALPANGCRGNTTEGLADAYLIHHLYELSKARYYRPS